MVKPPLVWIIPCHRCLPMLVTSCVAVNWCPKTVLALKRWWPGKIVWGLGSTHPLSAPAVHTPWIHPSVCHPPQVRLLSVNMVDVGLWRLYPIYFSCRSSAVVVCPSSGNFSYKRSPTAVGGHLGRLWCDHPGLPSGIASCPSADSQVSSLLGGWRWNGDLLRRKQLSRDSWSLQDRAPWQRQKEMAENTVQEIREEETKETGQEVTAKFKS